ncbi:unnamed protein product, partial [Mesorhabditis spiculigera]
MWEHQRNQQRANGTPITLQPRPQGASITPQPTLSARAANGALSQTPTQLRTVGQPFAPLQQIGPSRFSLPDAQAVLWQHERYPLSVQPVPIMRPGAPSAPQPTSSVRPLKSALRQPTIQFRPVEQLSEEQHALRESERLRQQALRTAAVEQLSGAPSVPRPTSSVRPLNSALRQPSMQLRPVEQLSAEQETLRESERLSKLSRRNAAVPEQLERERERNRARRANAGEEQREREASSRAEPGVPPQIGATGART